MGRCILNKNKGHYGHFLQVTTFTHLLASNFLPISIQLRYFARHSAYCSEVPTIHVNASPISPVSRVRKSSQSIIRFAGICGNNGFVCDTQAVSVKLALAINRTIHNFSCFMLNFSKFNFDFLLFSFQI